MKLLKSPLRRTSALLAGGLLGMAGVAGIAAPASAQTPSDRHNTTGTVTGTAECIPDEPTSWVVTWRVGNAADIPAYMSKIETVPDLEVNGEIAYPDEKIPRHSVQFPFLQKEGYTAVEDTSINSVTIKIWLTWSVGKPNDDKDPTATATVTKPKECVAPPSDDPSTPPSDDPSTPPSSDPSTPPSSDPSTPPSSDPSPGPSDPPASGEPKAILDMDCTSLTIGLANPADGVPIKLHYKTSTGEERDSTINPGETKTETFKAGPGFTITVSAPELGDDASETIAYKQPAGCDTAGGGGGLPVTGAAAGAIAGGAALLLTVGGVLFFMARRRKIKFTA